MEIVGNVVALAVVLAAVVAGVYSEIKRNKAFQEREEAQTAMYTRILQKLEEEE